MGASNLTYHARVSRGFSTEVGKKDTTGATSSSTDKDGPVLTSVTPVKIYDATPSSGPMPTVVNAEGKEVPATSAAAASAVPLKGIAKIKDLWNKYGIVFAGTYFGIYFGTLGMMYVAVSRGWLVAVDVPAMLKSIGLAEMASKVDPKAGALGVAWILTKFTEPIRAFLTLLITPRLARAVGRAPPKPKTVQQAIKLQHEQQKQKL